MASQTRLIDRLPRIERQRPMAVIVLSPARSGTTSVESALTQLGENVYQGMKHAFLHAKRGENTYPQWSEALDAKYPLSLPEGQNKRYGVVKQYGTEDFEKILGNYTSCVGWPMSCFIDEALKAYPDVKIVLMDRPVDSWAKSMRRTLVTRLTWPSWKLLLPLENGLIRDCIQCGQRCLNSWTDAQPWNEKALKKHYEEHNDYVRKVVPKERLLVCKAEDGWKPLCDFLGKPVPDKPYPREASGPGFEKQGKIFWAMAVAKVTIKGLGLGVLGGVVYYGALWWMRKRQ